jgi:hypothetical protein
MLNQEKVLSVRPSGTDSRGRRALKVLLKLTHVRWINSAECLCNWPAPMKEEENSSTEPHQMVFLRSLAFGIAPDSFPDFHAHPQSITTAVSSGTNGSLSNMLSSLCVPWPIVVVPSLDVYLKIRAYPLEAGTVTP